MAEKKRKLGSWKYIKKKGVREWAKRKEQERLGCVEKKTGKSGHVYIFSLGIDDLYKVGCTTNVENRLAALKASNPFMRFVWSAHVPDMLAFERKLHKQLGGLKVQREIFRLEQRHVIMANEMANKER